ncbi:MAG: hypothetical protein SPM02_03100 [Bacteroidales bacterium]|nr:hypothetical protein [Bacteroidales bacterium]
MFYNNGITFGNRLGTMTLAGNISVNASAVSVTLPNNAFRLMGTKGQAYIQLSAPVPTGTTGTLPVVLVCNGVQLPLTTAAGVAVTAADLGQANILLVYVDKQANTVQLINLTI